MRVGIKAGIDLGGSKIEIIVLDEKGTETFRQRIATPQGKYQATLESIAGLLRNAENAVGTINSVGIGVPGSISPQSGLMRNANSTCLNGEPLEKDLQALLQRGVVITNDANCFALSEATDGAGKGATSVFGVIIGTGTGAGIVINGKLLNGINGVAGEWGHNPLPWPDQQEYPGQQCWCGQTGCIETWLSGPGMSRDHQEQFGEQLTTLEITQAADSGCRQSELTLQRYEKRLAKSLAHIINIIDPDVIVLGGGLSNLERLYSSVPTLWEPFIFSDCIRTRLLPPAYGDSSGVRGAAWLGAHS